MKAYHIIRNYLGPSVLLVLVALLAGCGKRPEEGQPKLVPPKPVVESSLAITLPTGQSVRLTEQFKGGPNHGELPTSSDGRLRLSLTEARRPALAVPAPYTLRLALNLPPGSVLRTAFGLGPESWNKSGAGARFIIRVKQAGQTTKLLSQVISRWQDETTPNWTPVSLPLPGGASELELVTEPAGEPRPGKPQNWAGSYALWMDPAINTPASPARPNIVLIVVDTLRADHLGCYGYPRDTSPNLDRLARRGALFEDASTQGTWTFASFQSMLTSSYRLLRGTKLPGGMARAKGAEAPTQPVSMPVSLQGELGKAGYRTLACVGGGFLDPSLGFDAGFDWYWSSTDALMFANQLSVVEQTLSATHDTPFFLLLHTYEVHNYFQGWAHDIGLFDHGYLGPLTDPRRLEDAYLNKRRSELTPADLQYIQDLYDGEIHHTDRYLGLFVEWLARQPWGKNTIVIITADHGEALGAHKTMSHGGTPYRELAHVPLIIYATDGRWAGQRISTPVALVDVLPTLLAFAGADAPASAVGWSLVPTLEGKRLPDRTIFCESSGPELLARDRNWWYLGARGEQPEQLYDLATDPQQTHNLITTVPAQADRMAEKLARATMRAARGYRLVLAGPRSHAIAVTLTSSAPLAHFDLPTARRESPVELTSMTGESDRYSLTLTFPPGQNTHVIRFDPSDPKARLEITAETGGAAVSHNRFHLGRKGVKAASATVSLGAAARTLLLSNTPPVPEQPADWGLWLWLPSTAVEQIKSRPLDTERLPDSLREQLKSLGYLR